jgi:nitrite reductase/ring-hydroxylating ferredoxin subunit
MFREMNKVLKINSSVIIFLALFTTFSCKKSTDYVPNVYVNTYLYTTDPAFAPLNAVSGYTYLSGGSKGIVVYRKSQTEFMAYDRCCTYKVSDGNVIDVDASGLIAKDAACGSKFILTDGTVNNGPAVNPLKRYQTAFDGTALHIFN